MLDELLTIVLCRRMITQEDLINAERSLYRIRHDMVYRRGELSRRLGGTEARDANPESGQGWMGRVFANTLGRNQGKFSIQSSFELFRRELTSRWIRNQFDAKRNTGFRSSRATDRARARCYETPAGE